MDRITAAVQQAVALQRALGHELQIADAYVSGAEEKSAGRILLHLVVVLKPDDADLCRTTPGLPQRREP